MRSGRWSLGPGAGAARLTASGGGFPRTFWNATSRSSGPIGFVRCTALSRLPPPAETGDWSPSLRVRMSTAPDAARAARNRLANTGSFQQPLDERGRFDSLPGWKVHHVAAFKQGVGEFVGQPLFGGDRRHFPVEEACQPEIGRASCRERV